MNLTLMKKLEYILIAGVAVGILLALFKVSYHTAISSLFLITLSIIYLYLGFALFNDIPVSKIFRPESYIGIGSWRIAIAIGTGLGLSQLTIGFLFTIGNYPMTRSLISFSLVTTALMLLLTLIRNKKDKHQFYRNIALRCALFIITGVAFLLVHVQHSQTT